MASDDSSDGSLSVSSDLEDWLDQQATEQGVDRDVVLERLLAAYRAASVSENGSTPTDTLADDIADQVARSEPMDARLDELRDDFMELIEDVRTRVIQVKREADSKAPQDHDHPDIVDSVGVARTEIAELEGEVEELDERVDTGFENFEDVVSYLTETTDDIDDRMETLARAVLDARTVLRRVQSMEATLAETNELKRSANRQGVRSADCEECSSTVDVSLLTEPKCPHCAAVFSDVEGKSGLFGSHTLVTGDRPALTGRTDADLDDSLDEMVDPEG